MNINTYKINYLNLQLIAIIGFVIALLTSYLLTLDKKLSLENKKRLFSQKQSQNLAIFQTILVFFVSFLFLYINYNQYKISKIIHDKDEKDLLLQSRTSLLAIISALAGIYIIFKNYKNNNLVIAETELF